MKVMRVQVLEDSIQIVDMATRGDDTLAPTHLSHQVGFLREVVRGEITAVLTIACRVRSLAIHFGKQEMCESAQNGGWRAFQKIRDADVKFVVAQPNIAVDVHEWKEADRKLGHGRARVEFAKGFLKEGDEALSHAVVSVAQMAVSWESWRMYRETS